MKKETKAPTTNEYFANKPREEAVGEIETLVEDYYKHLQVSGRLKLWNQSYNKYNAAVTSGSGLGSAGDHGEFSTLKVNHYRNFIQHLMNLTISQRPAFEPRATNTDVTSQTQTILARGLLDYYMREKRLERNLKKAVELCLIFAEGFVSTEWNATAGGTYTIDPETGEEVKEGDIEYNSHEPLNVIRDVQLEEWDNNTWLVLKTYQNKYDLAAKYPELAEEILNTTSEKNVKKYSYRNKLSTTSSDALIPVFKFYHEKTDAVPDGRLIEYINSSIVLTDGPLPYQNIPLFRVTYTDLIGSTQGYTPAFDLISLQEGIDTLYSTIMTNQSSFGVQNIMMPKGNSLSVTQLQGGLNLIEYDAQLGPPSPLNLTATPPEVFNFLNQLETTMETISGVNSVSRGNPDSNLHSGAALALVQSMAIQFTQQLQQSYVQLLEDVGTSTINILRDYAAVPRIAMIAGKHARGMMKEFTGADLGQVNRVIVDVGNPMTRTTAGKVELAQMMLQAGMIKTPDQMLQVIQTGNLDPLIEGKTVELLAIRSENEELVEGNPVPVMITDEHVLHIMEHKSTISDPTVRQDPQTIQTVTDHIMEHYKILSDPTIAPLLKLLGQMPVEASPQGGPAAQPTQGSEMALPANEQVNQMLPNMPNPPKNPMTGEPVELAKSSV